MKKIFVIVLTVIWLLSANYALAVETEVQVEVSENLKIIDIKPPALEKGEEGGILVTEVTIQNVGNTPAQFIVFASAKEEGGWASGRIILPSKGKLAPQEIAKGKIKTPYEGTKLPPVIKIEGSEKMF